MSSSSAPLTFDCTNCGARLPVDGSVRTVSCSYCRAEMVLPEALWLEFHPPAPPPRREIAISIPWRGPLFVGLGVAAIAVVAVGVAVVGAVARVSAVDVPATLAPLNAINGTTRQASPIAAVGEPCNGRRAACAPDGKAELSCGADGKMAVAGTCKGPNACRPASGGKSIHCDVTLADRGDPCDITDDACATDHKAELRCEGGHFAVVATCKGQDGCTLTPARGGDGYTLSCDDHIADVGDPCFDAERTACSSDKKARLTCTAQHFVVDRACKGGCLAKKIVGTGDTEMTCR